MRSTGRARSAARARHRRPPLERQLEAGEVELPPHRERDEFQRPVQVAFQLETQVHARPYTSGQGVVTTTRTLGETRSAPSIAVNGRMPKRRTSISTSATARSSTRRTTNSPDSSRPCSDKVPRTLP